MAPYEQSNFEQIATAIGVDVGQITKHANLFEEAARWYRLDKRRPRRNAPSSLRRKVDQVAKDEVYLSTLAWLSKGQLPR
jgi:hypothetical protein